MPFASWIKDPAIRGRPKSVPDENAFSAAAVGLNRKEIHEARKIRDAELRDVVAGVSQCEDLATPGQRDRFIEAALPAALSHGAIRKRPNDIPLRLRCRS